MTKSKFLKENNITEDQFLGKEKINGSLDLSGSNKYPRRI